MAQGEQLRLPARAGVQASCVVLPAGDWPDLLSFLNARFPHVAEGWSARMQAGDVLDEAGRPLGVAAPFRRGQRVWYYRTVPDEVPVPFALDILYRDARLLVVDKPHFLACMPGGRHARETVLARLRCLDPALADVAPVHRLDRETAGVLVCCLDPSWRGRYQQLFARREVVKRYEAIAPYAANLPTVYRSCLIEQPGAFVMSEVAGEPNSETWLSVLERRGAWARYGLQPVTGKKHQLRAHMAALGVPLLHDPWYPVLRHDKDVADFSQPLALLARSIRFVDPADGQLREFTSRRQLAWPQEEACLSR